jgi:hypothetical protein
MPVRPSHGYFTFRHRPVALVYELAGLCGMPSRLPLEGTPTTRRTRGWGRVPSTVDRALRLVEGEESL